MARGHVYKRGATWTFMAEVGAPGQRKQLSRGGFRTKKDATAALAEVQTSMSRGELVAPSRVTVREYLADEWLPAIVASVRPSTLASYRLHVERHIVPRLGASRLQQLTGGSLNALYAQLRDSGLAPATVRKTHTVLHRALRDAVRWGRLRVNVAANADPPKQSQPGNREMRTWSAGELSAFLRHARGDRLHPLFHLLASTGMRRGEVAGVRWIDVDLQVARLAVRQTHVAVGYTVQVGEPKSARSRRNVALDAGTVKVLRSWRAAQLRERVEWGSAWTDTGLVFTREDGSAVHPDRISKVFEDLVHGSGLPRLRLHDLRHTHATLALQAGVHPKVVSERLGHSTISLTLDTYSHAIPALQADAAALVAALLDDADEASP